MDVADSVNAVLQLFAARIRRAKRVTWMRLPAALNSYQRQPQHEPPGGVIMILEQESIDVFLGPDVGKSGHRAVVLKRARKKLYGKALLPGRPHQARGARRILVIEDPAAIGALPVAVTQAAGAAAGYLPGSAMHRIADLHPGQEKTDARDASVITEAAQPIAPSLQSHSAQLYVGH